ncbi:mRNA cap guanine-N7 methyltransferase [Nesidiocoris tenuis]|uniref:mRNA cap guanine-N(7) methyltransferase n=1 Tax=Nesidiocoris tenuis TaxID=355587 RepID=A0ABN7BI32_9HEMI|nr:mRNA cap guanine-N7 methyltransferase [Nesidiocoris tenuis]
MATPTSSADLPKGNAEIVQKHYNSIQEKGLDHRNQSRIVYLRNFNNWIKGMLIDQYLTVVKSKRKSAQEPIRVIDLCCGKGGDIFKWNKGEVSHVIGVDIADQSIADAQKRYSDMKAKNQRLFSAEFIVADVTRTSIRTLFKDPSMKVDLVSCQFSLHYSFESLGQAEKMMENMSASLKVGGLLIGTMPNAYDIVGRLKQSKTNWFGNSVFTIKFDEMPEPLPLFGAKYNFHLHEVVDCPEYLVHWPTLVRLAEQYGFRPISHRRFQNYYEEKKKDGQPLLYQMSALEMYPPASGTKLLGPSEDYKHAKEYFREYPGHKFIGTLTMSEWEVCTLYMTFVFEKVRDWVPKPQQ